MSASTSALPRRKRSTNRSLIVICFGGVLLSGIVVCGALWTTGLFYRKGSTEPGQEHDSRSAVANHKTTPSPAAPNSAEEGGDGVQSVDEVPTQISPYDLRRQQMANEDATNQRYQGRLLEITGVVTRVGKDVVSAPPKTLTAVDVANEDQPAFSISATLDQSFSTALQQAWVGKTVTIRGRYRTFLGCLFPCILVSMTDSPHQIVNAPSKGKSTGVQTVQNARTELQGRIDRYLGGQNDPHLLGGLFSISSVTARFDRIEIEQVLQKYDKNGNVLLNQFVGKIACAGADRITGAPKAERFELFELSFNEGDWNVR
jgi:hypothetical protein